LTTLYLTATVQQCMMTLTHGSSLSLYKYSTDPAMHMQHISNMVLCSACTVSRIVLAGLGPSRNTLRHRLSSQQHATATLLMENQHATAVDRPALCMTPVLRTSHCQIHMLSFQSSTCMKTLDLLFWQTIAAPISRVYTGYWVQPQKGLVLPRFKHRMLLCAC
jgi:hypothetical protein